MAYGRQVKDRNRPKEEARTGLEFSLALRFKQFTSPKHRDPLEVFNCKWPSDGKPRYKLVALFSNATLGRRYYRDPATPTIDDKQIEQRLTKLRGDYPDLRYVGWPVRI